MILRRKKKEKKARKLQEAQQQAFLASLQAGAATGQPIAFGSVSGSRRPPSAMSVPAVAYQEREYEYEENSGSDPDGEIMESHLSLTNVDISPQQQPQRIILDSQDYSPPSHVHTLPTQVMAPPMPPPQQTVASLTTSNSLQNISREIPYRKAISQPAFAIQPYIPTTVAEVPTPHMQLQQQPHVQQIQQIQQSPRSRTNGHGTLAKKPKDCKVLSPAKLELITAAVSLGLGRGVDATNKMPWINKKSFQIRRVHHSVVETNEGGILMNYNHEVQSIAEIEEKCLSSLTPPESSVTIHIEDELDRNFSSSRRIVGRRVVNRSIGFQADFEERYTDGEVPKSTKDSFLVPKDPAEVVYNTQASGHTFEERVCQWIFHRLVHKYGPSIHKIDTRGDESPVDQLARLINSKIVPQIEEEIKAGCQELIQDLRVTHYVARMQLGAAEYRVMSDGQYHKKLASEGAFGVDTLANAISTKSKKQSKKEASKCSQLRKIGKIEDCHVAKGTQDEVVLQVQIQPITRLIRLPILKSALSATLEKYMEGTPSTEGLLKYF